MKFSLTKKITVLVALPFLGALIALLAFRSFLIHTKYDMEFINRAGSQRMISQSILTHSIKVNFGHDDDRKILNELIIKYSNNLNNLEASYRIRNESYPYINFNVLSEISQVENIWNPLKSQLQIVADNSIVDSLTIVAFAYVQSNIPNLTKASDNLVSAYEHKVDQLQSKTLKFIIGICILNFIFLWFGVFAIKLKIVKPVQMIEQVAKRIRDGDLKVRAPIDTKDEIASLAVSFNEMADNIEQLITEKENVQYYRDNIFETVPVGLAILDKERKIISVNKSFEQMFRGTEEEFADIHLMKAIGCINFISSEDNNCCESISESLDRLREFGGGFTGINQQIKLSDGTLHWYRFSASMVQAAGKNSEMTYLLSVDDLTESHKNQRLKDFSFSIREAATASEELSSFYRIIHSELKKVITADSCFIAIADYDKNMMTFPFFVDEADELENIERKMGLGLTEYLMGRSDAYFASYDELTALKKSNDIGLRGTMPMCLLGAPLISSGKVIGAVAIQDYHNKNTYQESDKDIMNLLAREISIAIERKWSAEALKESEERFKTLSAATFEGIGITENGKLIDSNEQLAEMLGYEIEELRGIDVKELIAPEDMDLVMSKMTEFYTEPYEHRALKKDGTQIYLEVRGEAATYEGRNVRITSIRNITESKQSAEVLKASEEKYRTLVESASDFIFLIDTDEIVLSMNQSAAIFLGGTPEQLIGKSVFELFPNDIAKGYSKTLGMVIRNDKKHTVESKLVVRGSEATLSTSLNPVRDHNGNVVAVMGVSRDITERMRAEEALRESEKRLQLAGKAAYDLIYEWDVKSDKLIWFGDIDSMLGFEQGEISKNFEAWLRLIHPEDQRMVKDAIERHRISTDQIKYEYRILMKNGSIRYWNEFALPMMDENGLPYKWIGVCTDITQRKNADEALIKSKKLLEKTFDSLDDAVFVVDLPNRIIISCNQAAEKLFGYTQNEMLGKHAEFFHLSSERYKKFANEQDSALVLGSVYQSEYIHKRKDGTAFPTENSVTLLTDENGNTTGMVRVIRDITEKKSLEAQFLQSQKMEAIGRLAGGIAHDFNNALMVISGFNELLMDSLDENDPIFSNTKEIEKAANHAADLTRQLLAFSRQQTFLLKVVDINDLYENMNKMLKRLIGEDINLTMKCGKDLWNVKVDSSQMQQVLINLAVNSRDAMPNGGKLMIETENTVLDENFCKEHPDAVEGEYVMVSILDTGTGMSKEVSEKIFEPFYTTKEVDLGTGLGLSTVYGIIKQSGGYIWVETEEGKGTTFYFYVPKTIGEVEIREPMPKKIDVSIGSEKILVVEDDKMLRKYIVIVLNDLNYIVKDASSAEHAIQICDEEENFDIVLTDVVMPDMSGPALIERLQLKWADLKVIYMSGHPADKIKKEIDMPNFNFLQKPFRPQLLADLVRKVIDSN